MSKAPFTLHIPHNPDILDCIASLSSDEVFTPPRFAKRILDELAIAWESEYDGEDIWKNKEVRFLDPFTKTGVFLREIAKRLVEGLADEIPDLQERVDHVLARQVFGIGITGLTAMLARRSVYCSKHANGEHSITKAFTTEEGNIHYTENDHTWSKGECTYCGVKRSGDFGDRGDLESHAYKFTHTDDIKRLLRETFASDMDFDVIIGNPPYQIKPQGGTRDKPIYNQFVDQAKRLNPRFICMVIPSRWYTTGLGLDAFRASMLTDRRIESITTYPLAKEVFPSVEIKGGVCYFLWHRDHDGDCSMTEIRGEDSWGPSPRRLDEHHLPDARGKVKPVLIQDVRGIPILEKVVEKGETSITSILSADKAFGESFTSNHRNLDVREEPESEDIPLYRIRSTKRSTVFIDRDRVEKKKEDIDEWKVMIPSAGSDGGQRLPDYVLGNSLIAQPPSVCTQSYLYFKVSSEVQADSLRSYICTRFFRFLVSLVKITQHGSPRFYHFVPMQTWDRDWNDEMLYDKYGLTTDEIDYIESRITTLEIDP